MFRIHYHFLTLPNHLIVPYPVHQTSFIFFNVYRYCVNRMMYGNYCARFKALQKILIKHIISVIYEILPR